MLKLQIVGLISMLSAVAALALALNTRRSNNLALRRHFDLIAPANSAGAVGSEKPHMQLDANASSSARSFSALPVSAFPANGHLYCSPEVDLSSPSALD